MARSRMSEREPGEREEEEREGPPTPRPPVEEPPPPAPPERQPDRPSAARPRILMVWPPAWGPAPPQAANSRQLPDGVVALRDGIDPTI